MSGPLTPDETALGDGAAPVPNPCVEITPSRAAMVDGQAVRRALPYRARRSVGAWCFADHMGPSRIDAARALGIGPHPHIGLQTVTWLLEGAVLHRDSLGSEQLIRPGQLNLMTAGNGVAHAEESPLGAEGALHGIQLWVAQPERTRHGEAAFEHHATLPRLELDGAVATVMVGDFASVVSPARHDTDHVGVELRLQRGTAALPLRRDYEYAIVVLEGAVTIGDAVVTPGSLGYLGLGRTELVLRTTATTTLVLLGGVPFEAPLVMWWNFVGRSRDEIAAARQSWELDDGRFGRVSSRLARIPAPPLPWSAQA